MKKGFKTLFVLSRLGFRAQEREQERQGLDRDLTIDASSFTHSEFKHN